MIHHRAWYFDVFVGRNLAFLVEDSGRTGRYSANYFLSLGSTGERTLRR